tara:strand:- start:67 stop:645 length:579 start_codon:yes stop_codon:yes gene_type:complete
MFKNIILSVAVVALVDAHASIPACTSVDCKKATAADKYEVPKVAPELGPGQFYSLNQAKLVQIMNEESESSDDEEDLVQMYGMVPVPDADRFANDDDDIFMRSVLANYSTAGAVSKAEATACASEVLCTHKKICGAELTSYLGAYLSKAWGHFDVNQSGSFEAIKMPQFIRFLASDQYFQFMTPKDQVTPKA